MLLLKHELMKLVYRPKWRCSDNAVVCFPNMLLTLKSGLLSPVVILYFVLF